MARSRSFVRFFPLSEKFRARRLVFIHANIMEDGSGGDECLAVRGVDGIDEGKGGLGPIQVINGENSGITTVGILGR